MFELIKNNQQLNTIESLFNNFFTEVFNDSNSINYRDFYLSDDEKNYYIEIALPGIDKKDIDLNINGDYLYLNYESEEDLDCSFWKRSFKRRIKLPHDIKSGGITAESKDGILSIKLEKNKKSIKNKKIDIK